MKIFYSWQSELKRKVTRDVIMNALVIAVDQIKSAPVIQEAIRKNIEIDHDTKGILGNPSVADTIFKKIDECTILLADVSIVNVRKNGNGSINSNVAIELGYGYGKHGDGISILVMNEAFGDANILPFDLAHRRHPISFNLEEASSKDEIQKATQTLANAFKTVIESYTEKHSDGRKERSIDEFKNWLSQVVGQSHADSFLSNKRSVMDIAMNGTTAEEMFKFRESGLISVQSTHTQMNLGAGHRVGNTIEDKTRPYGMGSVFRISHPIGALNFYK